MSYTTTWLIEPVELINVLRMNSSKLTVPPLEFIPRELLQLVAEEYFVALLPQLTSTINSYTSLKSSTPLGTVYKKIANAYISVIRQQAALNQQTGTVVLLPQEVFEVTRTYSSTFIESLIRLSGKRPTIDVDVVPSYVVQSFAQSFLRIEMSRLGNSAPYGDILKKTADWWHDVMSASIVPDEGVVLVNQFQEWLTNEYGVLLSPT